ncbi:hypothetical protein GJ496_003124 [Pomphorhynchus laevis]|nr:hypothetical protein GJ496_003124 [Pomphorhynchus laevis]
MQISAKTTVINEKVFERAYIMARTRKFWLNYPDHRDNNADKVGEINGHFCRLTSDHWAEIFDILTKRYSIPTNPI